MSNNIDFSNLLTEDNKSNISLPTVSLPKPVLSNPQQQTFIQIPAPSISLDEIKTIQCIKPKQQSSSSISNHVPIQKKHEDDFNKIFESENGHPKERATYNVQHANKENRRLIKNKIKVKKQEDKEDEKDKPKKKVHVSDIIAMSVFIIGLILFIIVVGYIIPFSNPLFSQIINPILGLIGR